MRIGYIHSPIIGHWRYKEAIKILCSKIGAEFYVSSLHKHHKDHLSKYKDCDLVIDENRLYQRQKKDQKIVYWYTGSGDLSSLARDARQSCPNIDYIILPKVRGIKENSRYFKYKMIGNPMSIYFDNFKSVVSDGLQNMILVPEENCYNMDPIVKVAKEIAKDEGLEVLYKTRDNEENIDKGFSYHARAKYTVTGFSTMAFDGLFFGTKFVMVKGLTPSNRGNNNQLFYRELMQDYGKCFIGSHTEFKSAINSFDYDKAYNEHYNPNFISDFMELISGN